MAAGVRTDEGYRWLHPHRRLAGCIYAAIVGDTRAMALTPDERVNYFPAIPFCTLSFFLEGQSILVDGHREGDGPMVLPRAVLSGPQAGPTVSVNPGPVLALSIGLFPDAVQRLTGQDVSALRDRFLDAETALPPDLARLCAAVAACSEVEVAFACFQEGLDPLWQARRPAASPSSRLVGDWTRALFHQATTSHVGRSLRQIERRMKLWTGQSHRELAVLARMEETFIEAFQGLEQDREDWARLAAGTGYADQPHLVREVRRVTGFSPEQLRKRIKTDRAFWYYRLMGELY